MTHWFEHIVTILGRMPIISAAYAWVYELPRAIRSWVLILACGGMLAVCMVVYSMYLFVVYSGPLVSEPERTSTSNAFSFEAVQDVVTKINDRSVSVDHVQVVDPSR